ncbi:hypothetical protein SAMN04488697_103414 [Pseudomonas sp. 43mfcvi1.1]|uniref:hypothetical protein n=1 Tax=Pseudomonas sp. 43mfcvi1.1 TaxID=1761894 RepID=UPI000D79DDF0|nr:hypothetical protein [Pseudomonas sp. 43mfcvi1.1]PWJ39821.1 hypothetical protein ATJ40_103414 [Pseudomonas sp. 43mfcvi1.1]SSB95811.1 hypothetical protein SAMN04488697_103414 [Pseudomonas sp. 43mfcvi1.1]
MIDNKFPSAQEFCSELPLYYYYEVNDSNLENFVSFARKTATIDVFCPACLKDSTFKLRENNYGRNSIDIDTWWEYYPFYEMRFICSRDREHEISYTFQFDKNKGVQKIGQYPSVYDVAIPKVKSYRKVLGEEQYKEFIKAIGLFSHGVGAGSLIYLRRIFENLLEKAHLEANQSEEWLKVHSATYTRATVSKKIEALADYLPEYLVGNKKIYSILSLGVHSTPEEECLHLFPLMRVAIELILDQKIQTARRKRKEAEIASLLHQIP